MLVWQENFLTGESVKNPNKIKKKLNNGKQCGNLFRRYHLVRIASQKEKQALFHVRQLQRVPKQLQRLGNEQAAGHNRSA